MGRALHLKGGVGLLDKCGLCWAGPKGPVGTWSWTWEATWLPVSATLLAMSSFTFMIRINWVMPIAHVMVAWSNSTCRGQIWIPAVYLQTILPESWRICLINKLRYARYEHLAFHEWTWFLLYALVWIWVIARPLSQCYTEHWYWVFNYWRECWGWGQVKCLVSFSWHVLGSPHFQLVFSC